MLSESEVRRFEGKIDRSAGPDACWPWIGNVSPRGTPAFPIVRNGRKTTISARRVVWERIHGEQPGRKRFVQRTCDTQSCVNPAHLRVPTLEDRFWARVDKNGPIVRPELGPCWVWTGNVGTHHRNGAALPVQPVGGTRWRARGLHDVAGCLVGTRA